MPNSNMIINNINEMPMDRISVTPEKFYLSKDPANARKYIFSNPVRLCNYGFVQILLVSSGSGKAIVDGHNCPVKSGLLFILNQGVTLEFCPVSPIIAYSCSFLPELFYCHSSPVCSITDVSESKILSFFFQNKNIELPVLRIIGLKIDTFREVFNKMIMLTDDSSPAYCDLMQLYIAELLIRVSETFYKSPEVPGDEDIDDARMIRNVTNYIKNNFTIKHTYDSLARVACVSRSKLFTKFKELTGKSIGEYIKMVRINQACTLLSETDKSVYDIMLDVGYNDMKMFCKRFREFVQMTPTEYRKQYRK